jgi:DNA-binding IclR family transcriptional regulator
LERHSRNAADGSQTLDRALAVLVRVGESGPRGLTLAECTALLGYSKPTTHRILRTLTAHGFLRADADRGLYTLGVANLRLGMDFLDGLDLRREALPLLRQLADETGETAHLAVLDGADVVYIEKVESRQAVRMVSRIGHTMPAHSTGVGKAILAFLDPVPLEEALAPELERRTATTIVDRRRLLRHLAEARAVGYTTDVGENEPGIHCVGAPVFDHTGAVCAAISVAGPAGRVSVERFPELGELLQDTARALSERIGHVPAEELVR